MALRSAYDISNQTGPNFCATSTEQLDTSLDLVGSTAHTNNARRFRTHRVWQVALESNP